MRRILFAAPFLVVVLALGAAEGPLVARARPVRIGRYAEIPYGISVRHPWATQGGTPRRASRSRLAAVDELPKLAWSKGSGFRRAFPPAISEKGVLFVGSAAGLSALTEDGREIWRRSLGPVSGTPSITPDGDLAVGAQATGEILILSAARGLTVRRIPAGGGVFGSPLVLDDGSVVVGAFDAAVHRFDAEGRRLFRTTLPGHVRGPPAWDGEDTLVVAAGAQVLFLSLRGEVRARALLGEDVVAGPAIADDGTVWVLTAQGVLHALSLDGRTRARTEVGAGVSPSTELAIGSDGAVRLGVREGGVVSVGPNGTERWRLATEGAFSAGISVDANDVTLSVNQDGVMVAIDASGHLAWRVVATRTDAAPIVGPGGTVYLSTFQGRVEAWK